VTLNWGKKGYAFIKRSLVKVSFPDGKKIDATIGEFTINTDQKIENGGDESAPEPFQLFIWYHFLSDK
jgi:hypothetical protein